MTEKLIMLDKMQVVSSIKESIENTNLVLFLDFRGLSVPELTELRGSIQKENGNSKVYKNTLTRIALKNLNYDYPEDFLVGPSLVATSGESIVEFTKSITTFAKDNDSLKIKGGMLNSKAISSEEILQLSKLPSREELIAKFVGQLNAPVSGFVNVLSSQIRKLVLTLKAIEEKKTGGEL